ncbi:hypothetical protein PIB30_005080 [Stylosanthes scabra]|uniref:Replication protein A 70 kDa DNA-binding subunit B/D first OB fold domain-containing protein n=1 Tax=Stylosanthes scabra TaxID=79078 RepID=A0ABU6Z2J8_9FABA|nr:hypothetical protein [Stylosanthes scabra]
MAGVQDMFADLHRRRLDWRFRVYVKRIFEHRFSGSEDFTLEMVLEDSEGVKVHASVPKALVNQWVGVLKEFKMYQMSFFIVVEKKHYIRYTNTRYTLSFSHRTEVVPVKCLVRINDLRLLAPRAEPALSAGRILPQYMQDRIKFAYGVIFKENRLQRECAIAEEISDC